LASVGQTIGASTAAVTSAQERLIEAEASRDNIREQASRVPQLVEKGVYAKAREDRAVKEIEVAEANVREAASEVERAKQELGPQGSDNPQFREALAAVEQAKLDLLRTTVLAPSDGVITNLQLTDGEFVAVGQAALTFIDTSDVWINANFRENSLENGKPDDPVELVLDTLPGRIFAAKVQSVGWGVSQGSIDPETGLPKIGEPMGLVRNPQRFTVKIEPNRSDYAPGSVRYASQANVVVYATDNAVVNALGAFWIRLVAILTYVNAYGLVYTLIAGSVLAVLLVLLAYAFFRAGDHTNDVVNLPAAERFPVGAALANAAVLMSLVTLFISSGSPVTVIIIMTAITILRQPPIAGHGTAYGFVIGNVAGGIAATAAHPLRRGVVRLCAL
jgi:multidrug resistance efflux pump